MLESLSHTHTQTYAHARTHKKAVIRIAGVFHMHTWKNYEKIEQSWYVRKSDNILTNVDQYKINKNNSESETEP